MNNGFISRAGYWAEGAQSKGEVLVINLLPPYPLISLKKKMKLWVCVSMHNTNEYFQMYQCHFQMMLSSHGNSRGHRDLLLSQADMWVPQLNVHAMHGQQMWKAVKKNETNKQRKKHSPKLTCRAQLISKRHRTGRCKWKWKQRPMPAVQPGCWSSAGREGTGAPASPLLSACLPGGSPRHEPNPTTTRWLCGLCADENLSAQSDIPVPAVPPEILTPSPLS